MLKVSDAFNSAFAAPDRELHARVTIGKTVYDSDDLTSINYDSGAMTGEQFSIGSTYMNSTKITFSHLVEGLKQLDEVLLEFGIVKADGTTEYVKMGTFIIDDKIQMDRNNNSTTIECMDRMVMLGGAYKSKLSYPATIKSVAVEIANMAGVRVNDTSFARLPNQSINEPIGYSYRDAIGIIAQFAMGFALFDRDGYLDIRTLVDSEFKIDPSQYFLKGLVKNETFFKLNGISCTVVTTSKDENGNETSKTTVLQSGSSSGSQIKLANNVMTQDVLDRMYESLKFTNYYPFTLNWNGNPAVEAGDWLTLEDMQGNEFKVPNMSFTLTFNGGLTASSKAETSTNSSVTYSYGGSMSNIVNEIGGRESAEGNHIYEGTEDQEPTLSKEGDLWYKHVGPDTEEWIYKDGKWEFLTSTKTANDAADAADKASKEAEEAKTQANKAVDGANDAVAKAGFANDTATQAKSDAATAGQQAKDALTSAGTAITDAQNALTNSSSAMADSAQARKDSATAAADASSAIAKANSTASEFGKVSQKADSALASALSAQNDASAAVSQASSAAADSKDAKQIAGAVSQSYKTLTDGSTMTIAELESGLAAKLTKTDLDGYSTQTWAQNQIKMTAEGINGTISSVKSTVDGQTTSINDLKADSNSFKSQFTTVNDTIGKHTTDIGTLQASSKELSTGFNTLTTDNGTNKNDISQLKQNAKEFSSTLETVKTQVQDSSVGTNLLLDSQTQMRKPSWYSQNNYWTEDRGTYLGSNIKYATNAWDNARYSYKDLLDRGVINTTDDFTYSIYFRVVGEDPAGMSYANIKFLSSATTKNHLIPLKLTSLKEGQWARIVVPFKFMDIEYDSAQDYNYLIRVEMEAAPKVAGARYEFAAPKLEKGLVATDYSINPEDTATVIALSKLSQTVDGMKIDISKKIEQKDLNGYATQTWTQGKLDLTASGFKTQISSVKDGLTKQYTQLQQTLASVQLTANNAVTQSQYTQLADYINLRVQKGDVINQINISPESILIAGQKVHITGQTSIDNAVIKDAMIADIKADKITAGTLNAANVDVINLNANNITTGTIKGANLSMNLNTGEVLFQRGRIHSASNNIDINIDQGYLSTASNDTRVMLKEGQLQLVQPTIFDNSKDPYLQISNSIGGASFNGANIIARDYLVLANRANSDGFFDAPLDEPETFAGLAVGKTSAGRWKPTRIGGADRGIIMRGGTAYMIDSSFMYKESPAIFVGTDGAGSKPSDRIYINGSYVHITSAYWRTASGSANLMVARDGALVRSTSASKYKTDIVRTNIPDYGEKLLNLPTATWTDIAETKRYQDNPTTQPKPTRNFGMIAEDLADVGLEMLVVRGTDGELEGINYDRIGPALIPVIAKLKNEVETLKQQLEAETA